jgi:3-oxoacyl-[acyl-carrier protein] reductase
MSGPLLVTTAAAKHFVAGASVINIGSTAPLLRSESTTVYTATKAALDAVTGVLAKELGPKGIRINSVNPGFTITEGTGRSPVNSFGSGLMILRNRRSDKTPVDPRQHLDSEL